MYTFKCINVNPVWRRVITKSQFDTLTSVVTLSANDPKRAAKIASGYAGRMTVRMDGELYVVMVKGEEIARVQVVLK